MTHRSRATHPPVVLVADDQEWSVRSLESVLRPQGYATIRAVTERQALALARSARPDALILGYRMGTAVCAALRSDPRFSATVPIIIVAAGSDIRSHRAEAYRAGAWEVCTEPLDIEILLSKLERFVDAKLEADAIRDRSFVDEDTGLYSFRGFARRAKEMGAELSRRRDSVSCVAFAPLIDSADDATAREAAGEPAVAEYIGGVCRRSTRVSDIVGRIGSSEYVVLAPATDDDGAARLAERIQAAIRAQPFEASGPSRTLRLRMVQATVPNLADVPIDTLDLVERTTAALRRGPAAPEAPANSMSPPGRPEPTR